MYKRLQQRLHIGVSRSAISMVHTHGWPRPRTTTLADLRWPVPEDDTAQLAAGISGLIAEHRCGGLVTRIVLADDLVRLFMVAPPANAASLRDCVSAAHMRFHALYGETAQAWRLQADWNDVHPFLACAMPQPLLDTLEQTARTHRLTLLGIAPHFIAAWNGWRPQLSDGTWLGVAGDGRLTLGAVHRHGLCAIRSAAVEPAAWRDAHYLAEHVGREALRLNLPIPKQVQLCGQLPARWAGRQTGPLLISRLCADGAGTTLAHCGLRT